MIQDEIKDIARKYVADVYGGDTDFIDEAENVITWLLRDYCVVSLEAVEREVADSHYTDDDADIASIVSGQMLKRLFGEDLFGKEGEG